MRHFSGTLLRNSVPVLAAVFLPLAGLGADTPTAKAVPTARYLRAKVPIPLFTPDRTALLGSECERIAGYLVRHAAVTFTDGVLKGNAAARTKARLYLAVSLHLQPGNAAVEHCELRWLDGKKPSLPAPGEPPGTLSVFLLSAAKRQADKAGSPSDALSLVLVRLAADLDPANEEAVYASERQDRDGKSPPLQELLAGTLKAPASR